MRKRPAAETTEGGAKKRGRPKKKPAAAAAKKDNDAEEAEEEEEEGGATPGAEEEKLAAAKEKDSVDSFDPELANKDKRYQVSEYYVRTGRGDMTALAAREFWNNMAAAERAVWQERCATHNSKLDS